jgi:hypothetical protein
MDGSVDGGLSVVASDLWAQWIRRRHRLSTRGVMVSSSSSSAVAVGGGGISKTKTTTTGPMWDTSPSWGWRGKQVRRRRRGRQQACCLGAHAQAQIHHAGDL